MSESWTCPYCNKDCTVGENDIREIEGTQYISEDYKHYKSVTTIVVCPNKSCREQTIFLNIYEYFPQSYRTGNRIYNWYLKPESEAKPFPDFIPIQLRNDYEEACLIKTKSPKASATLSRRCLQGMIRDFWGIKKDRLIDEINALEEKVDASTWKAIDSVRHVGNIGAHMEKDVNLIIDIDQEEASLLIWLIETLFEEWYIAKHEKDMKMKAIIELANTKKEEKKNSQQGTTADGGNAGGANGGS